MINKIRINWYELNNNNPDVMTINDCDYDNVWTIETETFNNVYTDWITVKNSYLREKTITIKGKLKSNSRDSLNNVIDWFKSSIFKKWKIFIEIYRNINWVEKILWWYAVIKDWTNINRWPNWVTYCEYNIELNILDGCLYSQEFIYVTNNNVHNHSALQISWPYIWWSYIWNTYSKNMIITLIWQSLTTWYIKIWDNTTWIYLKINWWVKAGQEIEVNFKEKTVIDKWEWKQIDYSWTFFEIDNNTSLYYQNQNSSTFWLGIKYKPAYN